MKASTIRLVTSLTPKPVRRAARTELRRSALESDRWFDTEDVSSHEPVLIGGCGRSGTTLLRELLGRHPAFASGPETAILCDFPNPVRTAVEWDLDAQHLRTMAREASSVVRFAETFFAELCEREGKPRWIDKTPRNVRVVGRLLRQFPRGRFIHIMRDGRDVACSLRNHPKETVRRGRIVPAQNHQSIAEGSRRWRDDVGRGLAYRNHPRVLTVRYEDLVGHTEGSLREVCRFLDVAFDASMLEVEQAGPGRKPGQFLNNANAGTEVTRSRAGRWRRDMTSKERRDFARVGGELLIATGYAPDHGWVESEGP